MTNKRRKDLLALLFNENLFYQNKRLTRGGIILSSKKEKKDELYL
jgi:hypothetical protein